MNLIQQAQFISVDEIVEITRPEDVRYNAGPDEGMDELWQMSCFVTRGPRDPLFGKKSTRSL